MITAVVLAAGAATRFGSPKQAVLLEPVLERVRASSSIDDVVVVLAALEKDVEAAVVVLGDGPDLDPRAIDRMVDAWRRGGDDRVAATYGGVRLHPVLLGRAAWENVPDEGLRGLPAALVSCDDLKSPGDVDFADELEGWPPRKEE